MINYKLVSSTFISILLLVAFKCLTAQSTPPLKTQIAFMADVHLQDVYGEFDDSDYKGVQNPTNGEYVMIRTMQTQLYSTRIFNENYFAFLAALDNVVERGVKYLVLPGDFSDDGQAVNVRGLQHILKEYTEKYDIHFLATTGNHDPVRPFALDAGKQDFLGDGGKPQAIMSKAGMYTPKSSDEHPVVITKDIQKMGYEGIIAVLSEFGFYPKSKDIYWETPFTTYDYENYSFAQAAEGAKFPNRNYLIPPYNTPMPDVSYLVEPEEGLWFLAIDANVYVPSSNAKNAPENPSNYKGSSIGYDNVLTHKAHLIDWVKTVTQRAEEYGKTLIVFSHYPMIEFNNEASSHITALLGEGKMQTHRIPNEEVARQFANAGVKLHFGGHMHINDLGIRKTDKGNSLINVQVPSLAAYKPAYKLVTVVSKGIVEIETIVIDSVPRFNELFPLYEKEHAYLTSINASNIWNKDILMSSSYLEFTSWHLRELLRLRFLENDWPKEFKAFLLESSGKDLLIYSKAPIDIPEGELMEYETWTGLDMIFDLYRLWSADVSAINDIGEDRIAQYQKINKAFLDNLKTAQDKFASELHHFASIFDLFLKGNAADHFRVDLDKGELTEVKHATRIITHRETTPSNFTFYPNPARAKEEITIESNYFNSPISIFDLNGRLVLSNVSDNNGNSKLYLNRFLSGTYLLKIGSSIKKLTVL